jgi:hypothetical protein
VSVCIGDSPAWLLALVARGGDGFVEIRYGRNGYPRRHFMPAERVAEAPEEVVSWTLELTEHNDVAVGMTVRGSKRGDNTDCVRANLLWADIDGDRTKLDACPHQPHLLVESGTPGHLHAYFALAEPVELADESERHDFLVALHGIQHSVGSDSVGDLARIMRVPGTLNWKRCKVEADDPDMAVPIEFRPEGVLL